MSPFRRVSRHACLALLLGLSPAGAQAPRGIDLVLSGPVERVFAAATDGCDGSDVADAPARALRDAEGGIVLFGLHDTNHALRGPDLSHLKIDCRTALPSNAKADPAAFDDRSWITALATRDGRRITALVHDEYHGAEHAGRCAFKDYTPCWYNTIVAATSTDGGRTFTRPNPPVVVAAAPFGQEAEQGRHRGFFNPSNIVADGGFSYMLASTTGWAGQAGGVCLFRNADPLDATGWRAFEGRGFSARFGDPYRGGATASTCATIAPFPAPVGSITRLRGSGLFVAVFMAAKDGRTFPRSGFYTSASRDLVTWSAPRLVVAGAMLYDDPCTSGGGLIAYPSLIDRRSVSRTFEDVGDGADLYWASLPVKGCAIGGTRDMLRRSVSFQPAP